MSKDLVHGKGKKNNLPLIHVEKLLLKNEDEYFRVSICFISLDGYINSSLAEEYLHSEELDYFNTVKHEKRKQSYLLGRCSAKQAFMALAGENDPKDVLIKPGVLGQPVVKYGNKQDIQVSITHCDNLGAAIGFLEDLPMGIDIEKVNPDKTAVLESQLTNEEKEKAKSVSYPYHAILTAVWTVKEALSKVLRTGLTTPFKLFEISNIEVEESYITSYFKHFGQYKAVSFDLGKYICSIVYPKKTEFDIDLDALKQKINFALHQNERIFGKSLL